MDNAATGYPDKQEVLDRTSVVTKNASCNLPFTGSPVDLQPRCRTWLKEPPHRGANALFPKDPSLNNRIGWRSGNPFTRHAAVGRHPSLSLL